MKKTLSLLLAIVMVFSLLPLTAFAATAGGKITFTTTFEEGMTVGDTFTVTATLEANPGIASFANQLTWNDKVLQFDGFTTAYNEDDEEDQLVTELFPSSWVVNHDIGYATLARSKNTTKTGMLYEANFTIIAGGDLNLGLAQTQPDIDENFTFADENGNSYQPTIDLSALQGLKASGEAAAPDIPEDAPFSAITTNAGNVIAIADPVDLTFDPYGMDMSETEAPHYHITIPAGATEVYISFKEELATFVPQDYMIGSERERGANFCVVNEDALGEEDPKSGMAALLHTEDSETTLIFSMTFPGGDFAGGSYELSALKTEDAPYYAYGPSIGNDQVLALFSFEYGAASSGGEVPHEHNFNCTVATSDYMKTPATCEDPAVYYFSCECGEKGSGTFEFGTANGHTYENGVCTVCSKPQPTERFGYYYAISADGSTNADGYAVIKVKITGHSNPDVTTYNAYDLTLNFDDEVLELAKGADGNYLYSGAAESDTVDISVAGNTIRIAGVGAAKTFDQVPATLYFKPIAEGPATVEITKVQVSDKEASVDSNVPEAEAKQDPEDSTADTTPSQSVITVPYTVQKPDFVIGDQTVIIHGNDYTFWLDDTNSSHYTYSDIQITMGDVSIVTPTPVDGKYTVTDVAGKLIISVTRTAVEHAVTIVADEGVVDGAEKATYGVPYTFTVTPAEGKEIESVIVTKGDDTVSYSIEDGQYTIAGEAIDGALTITVVQKTTAAAETTITFEGVTEAEVEDGLTQTAPIGQAFTFTLNMEDGYSYTAQVGERILEQTETPGEFLIPADLVTEGGVIVVITKEAVANVKLEVNEYLKLNGKSMFLVIAKDGDKVLAYNGETMYYSGKYTVGEEAAGAYCWLVISDQSLEEVKAAAKQAITVVTENVDVATIAYGYDINGSTQVDINDAQLAYDMYNASYDDFSETLTMRKFLEADVSDAETSVKALNALDVAAVVNYIVNH